MPENPTDTASDDERRNEVHVNQKWMPVHLPEQPSTKKLDLRSKRRCVLLIDVVDCIAVNREQAWGDAESLCAQLRVRNFICSLYVALGKRLHHALYVRAGTLQHDVQHVVRDVQVRGRQADERHGVEVR